MSVIRAARDVDMQTMTRAEFGALPDAQHLDAEITIAHGPERAAILNGDTRRSFRSESLE